MLSNALPVPGNSVARYSEFADGSWNRQADSLRRFEPVASGGLRLGERVVMTVSVRQATRQFGDVPDEQVVLVAPVGGDLVLVH